MKDKTKLWEWIMKYSYPTYERYVNSMCYDSNGNFEGEHVKKWQVETDAYLFKSIMMHNKPMLDLNAGAVKKAGAPFYYNSEWHDGEEHMIQNMYLCQYIVDFKLYKERDCIEVKVSARGVHHRPIIKSKETKTGKDGTTWESIEWEHKWVPYRISYKIIFVHGHMYFNKGKVFKHATTDQMRSVLNKDYHLFRYTLREIYPTADHDDIHDILCEAEENLYRIVYGGDAPIEFYGNLPFSPKTVIKHNLYSMSRVFAHIDKSFAKGGELHHLITSGWICDRFYRMYEVYNLFKKFKKKDLREVLKTLYELKDSDIRKEYIPLNSLCSVQSVNPFKNFEEHLVMKAFEQKVGDVVFTPQYKIGKFKKLGLDTPISLDNYQEYGMHFHKALTDSMLAFETDHPNGHQY